MKTLIVLIAIFISSIAAKTCSPRYDDLALKKCTSTDSMWTIHGWWPECNQESWPQFCDPSRYHEFNETAIESIREEMDRVWSSCPNFPSAYHLWKHEWQKHGTCVKPATSVLAYFTHTMNAFLQAEENNFYECCHDGEVECKIPFAMPLNETKWLGYCYKD